MAKYFFDTEFLEGTQKTLFGKTPATVDLISIGIIADDERTYYAISKDFNLKEAWNRCQPRTGQGDRNNIEPKEYWIRENVLKPIYYELTFPKNQPQTDAFFTYSLMKSLIKEYGKSNEQIADEIFRFVHFPIYKKWDDKISFIYEIIKMAYEQGEENHQFYAYYCSYDWVALCFLFGKMINLPVGFPMYCKDIQMMIDEYGINKEQLKKEVPQVNCHNALQDAIWNKKAYEYIISHT